ncbi:MAG: hypothetical protein RLZZ360_798 [Candidatus Parcubacteria bacterium]|jgi:hypothetical protein
MLIFPRVKPWREVPWLYRSSELLLEFVTLTHSSSTKSEEIGLDSRRRGVAKETYNGTVTPTTTLATKKMS